MSMLILALTLQLVAVSGPCDNAQNTVELEDCLTRELDSLNLEIREVVSRIEERFEERSWYRRRVLYDRAQRAWTLYRDLECESESAEFEGGSIAGVAALQCHLSVTEARLTELRDAYLY